MSKTEFVAQALNGALKGDGELIAGLRAAGAGRMLEEALAGGKQLVFGKQAMAGGTEAARTQVARRDLLWNEKVDGLDEIGFTAIPKFKLEGKGDEARMRICRTLAEVGSAPERVYTRASNAVGHVRDGNQAIGSCYFVGNGLAMTADHVVSVDGGLPLSGLKVYLRDGSSYPLRTIARLKDQDSALVKLEGAGDQLPKLALGRSDKLVSGESSFAVGHPGQFNVAVFTRGIFSGRTTNFELVEGAQTPSVTAVHALPSWGGYSGSPMMNSEAEVMATLARHGDGVSYGPVVDYAHTLLNGVYRRGIPDAGFYEVVAHSKLQSRPNYTYISVVPGKVQLIV